MKHVYIGDYRLIARLGRSATAQAFVTIRRGATDTRELIVVKRFREDVIEDSEHPALIVAAGLATRLHHDHIVHTYEVARAGNTWFSAAEYLEGQPLDRVLEAAQRKGVALTLGSVLQVVSDMLSALDYAHDLSAGGAALGIVHRAVCPHNVFLTYRGAAKLLDFGPVKRSNRDDPELLGLEGAYGYMAPEQAQRLPSDRRSDVFAVGVVLWECLARRRLFAVENAAVWLAKLTTEPLPPLAAIVPGLDPALFAICERALQRDPEARYASAGEMLAELRPLLTAHSDARAELALTMRVLFETDRQQRTRRIEELMGAEASSPSARVTTFGLTLEPNALPRSEPPRSSRPPPLAHVRARRLTTVSVIAAGLVGVAALLWAARRTTLEAEAGALRAVAEPAPQRPAPEIVLRLCGSNTIGAELAPALAEAFLPTRGGSDVSRRRDAAAERTTLLASLGDKQVAVEISAKGSATAFTGLADASCDIGMASRSITDAEADNLREHGQGDLRSPGAEHVIALDGIAVIVHPDNPLRALDRAALRGIFGGHVCDWSALGGAPGPITVLARDSNSGTFDTFKHLILGSDELVHDAKRYAQSDTLADAVAGDPSAIGFVGLAYTRAAKALAVGEPGAAPMLPSQFTVATEGYLLSRRLYLYTLPKPRTPWIPAFVSFASSRRAQEITAKSQFVDLGLISRGVACDEHCSPGYAATVAHAERLSVDFRFRSGSDEPDSRARNDLERVLGFLGEHRGAKLLLLGFSDALGGAVANIKLSVERAKAIDTELALRGVHATRIKGFGADMPVASNDSPDGRQRNRRVEVWVEP